MQSFYIYNFLSLGLKTNSLPKFIKLPLLPQNQTILLISPHSDDVSVSCGGTINLLAPQNKIIPLLFFSGYRGVEGKDKVQGTQIREEEMKKEVRILKTAEPFFLRLKSYEKNDKITIKRDSLKVRDYLERLSPTIIFLPPQNDLQPRHKLATQITLQALKGCKSLHKKIRLFFYETPWSIFCGFDFNTAFLLPEKIFQKKMKAIRVHKSQLRRTPFNKAAQGLALLRASTVPEQRIGGYGNETLKLGDYMEVFQYSIFHPQHYL